MSEQIHRTESTVGGGFKIGLGIILALVIVFIVLPVTGCLVCTVCAGVMSEQNRSASGGAPSSPSLLRQATAPPTPVNVSRSFQGSGTSYTDSVHLYRGTARVEVEYDRVRRTEAFVVWLKRSNAQGGLFGGVLDQHLVANEVLSARTGTSASRTRKMVMINTEADYAFQVESNGPWKIRVQQGAP